MAFQKTVKSFSNLPLNNNLNGDHVVVKNTGKIYVWDEVKSIWIDINSTIHTLLQDVETKVEPIKSSMNKSIVILMSLNFIQMVINYILFYKLFGK